MDWEDGRLSFLTIQAVFLQVCRKSEMKKHFPDACKEMLQMLQT